jgi:hypothetical protein
MEYEANEPLLALLGHDDDERDEKRVFLSWS